MILELIIREPPSLCLAKSSFVAKAYAMGYGSAENICAVWQPDLFRLAPDAIVYAKVQRRYPCQKNQ